MASDELAVEVSPSPMASILPIVLYPALSGFSVMNPSKEELSGAKTVSVASSSFPISIRPS